jgi:membrane associated rhomboid family serine protease
VVTPLLIALNVVAFVYTLMLVPQGRALLAASFGVVPRRFLADLPAESVTVLTSMFLHADLSHVLFNMWTLYIFGDNVEEALGRWRFVGFYLLCGLIAAAAQVVVNPTSGVPMIGASGAIAGVVGAYLVFYPRAPVLTLNLVIPLWFFIGILPVVPAWLVAGEFFLVNLIRGLESLGTPGPGVAFFAHLGGFIGGFFYARAWRRDHAIRARAWQGWRGPPGSRLPRRSRRW